MATGLIAACFAGSVLIMRQGLSVLHKVESQADLLQELQVLGSLWTRDVMASDAAGNTCAPQGMSVLSPRDRDLATQFSGVFSRLVWRSHRCYYRNAAGEIRLVEQPIATPADLPTPLPALPSVGGKRLVLQTESLAFLQAGPKFTTVVTGQRQPFGRQQPERLRLEFSALARNH